MDAKRTLVVDESRMLSEEGRQWVTNLVTEMRTPRSKPANKNTGIAVSGEVSEAELESDHTQLPRQ